MFIVHNCESVSQSCYISVRFTCPVTAASSFHCLLKCLHYQRCLNLCQLILWCFPVQTENYNSSSSKIFSILNYLKRNFQRILNKVFIFLLISQVSLYKIMFHKFVARYFTICTSVVEYLYKRLKLLQFSHALCKYFTIYFCLSFYYRIPELNQYLSLNICVFCFLCDRCHQTRQSACIVL